MAEGDARVPARPVASRLGRWVAGATAGTATVALTTAVSTPARSGPYCRGACVTYPYTDVAAYVPRDYLWMYPAVLLMLLLVVLVGCLTALLPPDRRVLGEVGGAFVLVAVAALLLDYGVQLFVLQPAVLRRQTEGLSPWSQYDPDGVFIALEDVGYTVLAVAFVFLAAALHRSASRAGRLAGRVLLAAGVGTLALLVVCTARYRGQLGSRFEVLAIGLTWLSLAVASALLTRAFTAEGTATGPALPAAAREGRRAAGGAGR